MKSHDMTWHLATNHIASSHVTSQPITLLHFTSQPTTWHHTTSHHSTRHHHHGNKTSQYQNATARRNVWSLGIAVAGRPAHRFFPPWNFRPQLVRAVLVQNLYFSLCLVNHATRHPCKSSRILDTLALVSVKSNVNVEQSCSSPRVGHRFWSQQ